MLPFFVENAEENNEQYRVILSKYDQQLHIIDQMFSEGAMTMIPLHHRCALATGMLAFFAITAHPQGAFAVTDAEMVASAMTAAPKPVVQSATIVAMDEKGDMRTLRTGTNGFTCMPDNPTTPGPDPMCLDANAMQWAHAWMSHQPPPDKVGFIYMLAGGSDASNTDPYAKGPEAGNNWIATGAHVMIVGPAAKMMAGYSKGAAPDASKPYVMWAGTPYEHLMIPIQ